MKTTIEIAGHQIVISGDEENITVTATKDDEVIEEFSIEVDGSLEDDDEIQDFEGFGEEESDFDDLEDSDDDDFDDDEDSDEDSDEDFEDEESDFDDETDDEEVKAEGQLESFQKFIQRRRK